MLTAFSNALESEAQWPAKCCLNIIPADTIITHVDGPTKKKYRQRADEWSIPASERMYCSQPTCSTWIPPKNTNTENQSAKCPKCGHKSCTMCRGSFHNGGDCPSDSSIRATIDLAEIEGWKRCFSCNALVEHNKGCRHMTCRCKAQFCYICGLRWRTCACTEEDLVRVQHQADLRRHDHRFREARRDAAAVVAAEAAEDERRIIAEVEEFIRREAEREERTAEAKRRRVAEARRLREETRIAAVSLRYREFNNELELLHDLQKVPIAERHEFEQDSLKRDLQNALNVLSFRHPSEIETQEAASASKITAEKDQFSAEYQARLASERQIEDSYVADMFSFWAGKPEGEDKVRNARETLRKRQREYYILWESYRKQKIQATIEVENRKIEALRVRQLSEIKAAEGRARLEQVEWERKRWAEMRWVGEVVRERVVMLQELEQDEYARGEEMF